MPRFTLGYTVIKPKGTLRRPPYLVAMSKKYRPIVERLMGKHG